MDRRRRFIEGNAQSGESDIDGEGGLCTEAKLHDKDGDVINSQVEDDETRGEDGKEDEQPSGSREGTGVTLEAGECVERVVIFLQWPLCIGRQFT